MVANNRIVIAANAAWNLVNFRSNLIAALQSKGYEVVGAAPPDQVAERALEALGCRFQSLSIDSKGASPLRDLQTYLAFSRLLRREQPIAFLGYTVKPNVYGSMAASRLHIAAINNISGLGTAFIKRSWLTPLVKLLYKGGLRHSRVVFFQNTDDRDLFLKEKLVTLEQARLLPGSGVDIAFFAPRHGSASPAGGATTFLLIARLVRDKGVVEFLEAARRLKPSHPQVRFQILGFLDVENRTAISRETVEEWVSEGTIEYLGSAADVRPVIAAADVVVLPSYREGTSRVLLEAAAMGKPLVATNVPGCREVIDHGVNGLLCRVMDVGHLAEQMARMAAMTPEGRAAMGAAGRAKVVRQFDESIVIGHYLQAVDEIRYGAQ